MTDEGRVTESHGGQSSNARREHQVSRRRVLAATGVAASMAGCGGAGPGGGDGGTAGPTDTPTPVETPATTPDVSPSDCEPETISEDVTKDTTWSTGECPRVAIDGKIRVTNGATLTIESGVEVVGKQGSRLLVKSDGTLKSKGEPDTPVWFYGDSLVKGYWQAIEIRSDTGNELRNTVVRDAGRGDWANVWVQGGSRLSVSNSTFANSNTWGLVAEADAKLPEFSANEFSGNGAAALRIATPLVGMLDADSTYAGGNENDVIEVLNATVEDDATWPATDAPFLFDGKHRVVGTVTVAPGAEFQFTEGSRLLVKDDGALTADAGDGDPIVFEGADETPGHWQAIELRSNTVDNVLDNVVVAHGGRGDWANVWVQSNARIEMTNSTVRDSGTWGIVVEEGAKFEGSNNTYENNAEGAIRNENESS
jgi:hypothetical protein